jgi:hypothetical protein
MSGARQSVPSVRELARGLAVEVHARAVELRAHVETLNAAVMPCPMLREGGFEGLAGQQRRCT